LLSAEELTYKELNGHCFVHVEKQFKRFWLEIQTEGAVTSIVVQDLESFLEYALSDHCTLLVIWWDNSTEWLVYDTERIVAKDIERRLDIFEGCTSNIYFEHFKRRVSE
jgi:hypothetical protein